MKYKAVQEERVTQVVMLEIKPEVVSRLVCYSLILMLFVLVPFSRRALRLFILM